MTPIWPSVKQGSRMGRPGDLALPLCILLVVGGCSPRSDLDPYDLEIGASVERQVGGGETQVYRVGLTEGRFARVRVEQLGVDVVLALIAPDQQELVAVNSPIGGHGPELLALRVPATGFYELAVRAESRGAYRIEVEEHSGAETASREGRLAAESALTEGAALNHKGTAAARRQAIDKYQEARLYWQQSEERRREARASFSLGVLHEKVGELEPALELFHQVLAFWIEAGDEHGQAGALHKIGYVHHLRGAYGEALPFLRRALELRQALDESAGQAQTLSVLAVVELYRSEPQRALRSLETALSLSREAEHLGLEAALLNNLGGAYEVLGESRQPLIHYQQAAQIYASLGERQKQSDALNNVGAIFRNLGEYQRAFEHYRQALEIRQELGDRRGEATSLNSIGMAYLTLGEPGTARIYLDRALPLRREVGDRRGEATTLNNLGRIHAQLGDSESAMSFFRQALDQRRALGNRRGEATTLDFMGGVLTARGDYSQALQIFDRALELRREVGNRSHEALTLRSIAEVYAAQGRLTEARQFLVQALDLQRAVRDRVGEAQTLPVLARVERELGNLARARLHLESSLEIIESLRTNITSPDLRATFFAGKREAYLATIDVLMELHRRDPSLGMERHALEASERARARSLLDLLNEAGTEIRQGIAPELVERHQVVKRRLNYQSRQQLRLQSRKHGEAQAAQAEGEIASTLTELQAIEDEIRDQSPAYAALTEPRPLTATQLQGLLEAGTTLLEYSLGEARSFLWAVKRDSISTFELPAREVVEGAARRLYERWSTHDLLPDNRQQGEAVHLSQMLLSAVASRLEESSRLVVVADGALHYIPFGALPMPAEEGQAVAPYEPLLVRYEVVNLPSASVLALKRQEQAKAAPHAFAVLADPVFDSQDVRVSGVEATPEADDRRGRVGVSPGVGAPRSAPLKFPRLPASRREAEAITALVPREDVLTALDFEASRSLALSGELSQYRILHFATHGILDSRRPQLSGLVLSLVDEAGHAQNGFLRLPEIYNLGLSAELVVLSGCQTALGREIRGEGLVGLTRGFMYAGTPRVVASLWRVQDRATAELMTRFYSSLFNPDSTPAANLRAAQLSIWRETEWQNPHYWAAFILQGDWK